MPTVVQILSAMESTRFYDNFDAAFNEWQHYGGCIFFNPVETKPWGVIDHTPYPKKCTPTALRKLAVQTLEKGGISKWQITLEMKDWVD